MSEKYGGNGGESRRTDGGEPVREPLEDREEVENPATTVYRNVRDMGEEVSRRQVLAAAGIGIAGFLGWTTDVDGDGMSNGEELLRGRNPVAAGGDGGGAGGTGTPDEPPVRERALQHAQDNYPEYAGVVEEFINDGQLADRFIDEQLRLWLQAPGKVHREGRDFYHYERKILANGLLYANDWNMNGEPHLLPDGTPGPDYDTPFTLNPDGDAFMPRFYNASGQVHDVRTGEYLGFQPDDGDKVGKLGDRNGDGTIAAYLDGDVAPEDLTGQPITVTWMDTSDGPAEVDEAFDIMDEFFPEKPPVDSGIDFYGINGVMRDGVEAPPAVVSDGNEMIDYYESNVPDSLKGPVNYMILVEDGGNDSRATALATSPSPGGWAPVAGNGGFAAAYLTLHELYWHGLTQRPHPGERPEDTIASYPPRPQEPDELDFLDKEWETIMNAMTVENREYAQSLIEEDRSYE